MEVIVREIDDVKLVDLIGNLDTGTSPEAEMEINKLLEAGVKKMIINLEKTKYLSSSGLRVFLGTAKKLTAAGGTVKLCCPNDVVKDILDISGFSTILDVKATEEEAINDI